MKKSAIASIKALLAAIVVTAGIVQPAGAQDPVRIAVGVDPVFTPWWVAEEKGFFAKHNIKATLTQYASGPVVADTTMAGDADIGSSGTATWMPRIVRGGIVVLGTMATSPDAFKMAARTSIKSLADLKGKKVGSVGGSSTDYMWVLVARKIGLPDNGLNVVSIDPPELIPALDRGDIEAFMVWEPWPSRAVEVSGKDKVHLLASSGDIGYFLNFIVGANKNFVEQKPEVTARVLAALRDAIEYQNKERSEAVRIAATRNKVRPEMAAYVLGIYKYELAISEETAKAAQAEETWLRGIARLRGDPIDWSKTIDRRHFDRAMAIR